MIKLLNKLFARFGLELQPILKQRTLKLPEIDPALRESAINIIAQTKLLAGSGEYKRAQAMRALLNANPTATARQCSLALEVMLCTEAH